MENKIRGRVWRFPDNVDTDQIIPAEYLTTSKPEELAKHVFEKVRPEFAKNVQNGDIIVAGKNFGCGSSREHAPRALLGIGISAVIAESFARIFFRNSINIGLPVIECKIDVEEGDMLEIDFANGRIRDLRTASEFKFKRMAPFLLELINSGGLVPYVKNKLKCR